MSATEYTVDMRNMYFNLFEQLEIQKLCNYDAYKDFDQSQFEMIIDEAYKFAKNRCAPLNKSGDEEGCLFENGNVKTPQGFIDLYKEYCEMGWLGMKGDPQYGGQGLPAVMAIAGGSFFTGSNCAFSLYGLLGSGVAHVVEKFGNDALKSKYLENLYTGNWSGTMLLTEPNAGSDVGNSITSAEPLGDGKYKINGAKIFISAGEHDLSENIVHLTLARVKGAQAGSKGLSLFVVPKYVVNEDGNLGERNNVVCTGIEHKMGIKGSATCSLSLGDDGDCIGDIVGNEGDGIRIMFHMMNEARIDCGVQGATLSAAAFRNALSYAQERLQGSSVKEFKNPDAPKVPIVEHPDVRRMLLSMKAHTEGMLALLLYTAKLIDDAEQAPSEDEKRTAKGLVELLTPICKAYCSDKGFEMCSMALQTYGGYGYTQEYPAEQYLRDCRIAAIYEGTNGIQAMDLLARKLPMGSGAVFRGYLDQVVAICKQADEKEDLSGLGAKLKKTTETLGMAAGMLATMGMKQDLDGSLLWALPFLQAFGEVCIAHQLLWGAVIASEKISNGGLNPVEERFYKGKIASARYFINVECNNVDAINQSIQVSDRSALDIEFETLTDA